MMQRHSGTLNQSWFTRKAILGLPATGDGAARAAAGATQDSRVCGAGSTVTGGANL